MNLYEAAALARSLMKEHELTQWSFAFDHARRRFGCCNYTHRRITLSRPLTLLNTTDAVRDTLLHEIAHALAPGAGHGATWRATCRRIGANPVRCYDDKTVVSPPRRAGRYAMSCPRCGWTVARHRRTRRKLFCKACRGPVVIAGGGIAGISRFLSRPLKSPRVVTGGSK